MIIVKVQFKPLQPAAVVVKFPPLQPAAVKVNFKPLTTVVKVQFTTSF